MVIQAEKLMDAVVRLRLHLAVAAAVAAAAFALLSVGPSLATVVSFFWPLLLSTGFVLVAVAVILRISPPPGESSGADAGEELLDYVAGQPEEAAALAEEETVSDEQHQHVGDELRTAAAH